MATITEQELELQKARIKEWERQFEGAHKRKPTKGEIRKIPEIRTKHTESLLLTRVAYHEEEFASHLQIKCMSITLL